ncbi:hypothetical protein DC31_03030 [Microbacterium sp. CH12i]|nr:hypothetical protein DC31_03030 [Microbacterium sp. CH12i]
MLSSGLLGSGIQQLFRVEAKGAIAILVSKVPIVKEWAYAGIGFLLTGALFSHMAVEDSSVELLPALFLLALAVASWQHPLVAVRTHKPSAGMSYAFVRFCVLSVRRTYVRCSRAITTVSPSSSRKWFMGTKSLQ